MISRRALVTGGPGFIGRRVVARLRDAGFEVASLSLPGEPAPVEWGGDVAMHYGDLALDGTARAVPGPLDLIVHLASPVGLAGAYEAQWAAMVEGTRHVGALAARERARWLVVSSIAVYGDAIQRQSCDESTPFGAWQGAYGRAKQGQERVARELSAEHGLALTIVRPANVYGLGGASAWGDRLLDAIRATGGAVVGDADRNDAGLTYVENLADAIVLAATHPAAVGGTYNVCDGLGVTWRRFFDDMARLADRPPPPAYPLEAVRALALANEDPASLVPPKDASLPFLEGLNLVGYDNRIDAGRLRRELGWTPRIDYAAAFEQMRRTPGPHARPR